MTEPRKRSLKLMNEVLPDPRANLIAPRASQSSARTRTLAHLQRLLAASAAITLADCSRSAGYGVVDPIPGPADPDAGAPPLPVGADAAPAATVTPPSSMGYGVVDPMPAPACSGVEEQIDATATWTTTQGQKTLTIRAKVKHGRFAVAFGAASEATGGRILSRSVAHDALTFVVAPDPTAATTGLFVPISGTCDHRMFRVTFAIENLKGEREGGPHVEMNPY